MAKSPEEGMATLIQNLETKTGRSMEEWVATARSTGIGKHKELVDYIKANLGLTHGYANQIALRALASDDAPAAGSDDLIDAQYTGSKAGMRPLYEALIAAITGMGPDVEVSPKKTCVSLRRGKQFALIQPTAQRLDLGIILKGVPPAGRLEQNPSTMCTHRVRVSSEAEIDPELLGWLRQAYEAA
jgi:predicted transport protein